MKIIVNRESLAKSLSLGYSIIDSRPVMPIWDCFFFDVRKDSMYIYSRSSLLQVKAYQKIESEFEGNFVVPSRMFFETIRLLKCEEVELTMDEEVGNTLKIKAVGKRKIYKINTFEPDEFSVVEHKKGETVSMHGKTFSDIISTCGNIVNEKDLRTAFTGVSIRNHGDDLLEFCGTNGYLISRYTMKTDIKIKPVVLPKKACAIMSEVSNEGNIDITTTDNYFVVKNGPSEVSSIIIDSAFPPIHQFWDAEYKPDKFCLVTKNDMIDSLKIMGVYSKQKTRLTEFFVEGDSLIMRTESEDKGSNAEEALEIQNKDTDDFKVGYNVEFMSQIIASISTDLMKIHFTGPKKPAFIEESNQHEEVNKSFLIQAINI